MSHKALWALKFLKFYDQFDTDKLVILGLENLSVKDTDSIFLEAQLLQEILKY